MNSNKRSHATYILYDKEENWVELFSHLNNIQVLITFTVSMENDGRLPFLDSFPERGDNIMLMYVHSIQETHACRQIPSFYMATPTQVKWSACMTEVDKWLTYSGREEILLHCVLTSNGCDKSTIQAVSRVMSLRNVTENQKMKPKALLIMCQDSVTVGDERNSAIAEHDLSNHRPVEWQEAKILDTASRNRELKIKELYACSWQLRTSHSMKCGVGTSRLLAVNASLSAR